MVISKFLPDVFWENTRCEGGNICPSIKLNLKKGTRMYNYQSSEPLRSLYDHPFYKNLICPQGITCNPCPDDGGGGGLVILKDIIKHKKGC